MRIEEGPIETPEPISESQDEHLRRATDLDARIEGGDDQEEILSNEPQGTHNDPEAEDMARQVPPEITEGMLGG